MIDPIKISHYLADPIGWLEIEFTRLGLSRISFVDQPLKPVKLTGHSSAGDLKKCLDRYFTGKSVNFAIPFDYRSGTVFQKRVWEALLKIPYGQTRTYGQIAQDIGAPGASRAVGGANGSNRIPIVIPCHRVIKSDGSLGGYSSGTEIKRRLLELEGVSMP
jgi:methylated-DNA-[protein]-cysteine S-methyltransferase